MITNSLQTAITNAFTTLQTDVGTLISNNLVLTLGIMVALTVAFRFVPRLVKKYIRA